jgi:hypothetical protein
MRNPIIKRPVRLVLLLLAAWLGMTWFLHHDDKPGQPRKDYSEDSR